MNREEKQQLVDELVIDLTKTKHFYIADIGQLDVETVNSLRRLCFKKEVKLRVVKNTLLKRALESLNTDFNELYPVLNGYTSLMLSETPNLPAKLISEFRKTNTKPILKAAYVEESVYIGDNQLDALAALKTKDELIGDLVGLLQSPAKNVISALLSAKNNLAGIVKTLSEKEEN